MRSSLASGDNSKLKFDLKITCCHRKKQEKKLTKKKVSGRSVLDDMVVSGSRIEYDESIKDFEIHGTPVCFQQCKNHSPYRTRIYSNFHSLCARKDTNNSKVDKNRNSKLNKSRDNNHYRNSEQERYYASFRDKPSKKIINRKPINSVVTPRVPLEIKTSLFPQSQTNFHNFKEIPLFSSTEEAQRAIVHVLNCQNEKFPENRVRPFVSGNLLDRYIQDVYESLYKRHVETLNNICTVELPPHRRSIHIQNNDYLYEESQTLQEETVDAAKDETSEDDSENSEEELTEGFEQVSIDQPLVRVSPLSVT